MVEAGGQHIHSFRCGLDYAFILLLAVLGQQDAERVMPRLHRDILVSARKPLRLLQRVYESLQGRPEVGLLPTPRRYHAAVATAPSGFSDVSSVLIRPSRIGATLDRTPVRKHSASGLYARSCLFVFSLRATRAAGKTLGQQRCLLTLHPVARCRAIL